MFTRSFKPKRRAWIMPTHPTKPPHLRVGVRAPEERDAAEEQKLDVGVCKLTNKGFKLKALLSFSAIKL